MIEEEGHIPDAELGKAQEINRQVTDGVLTGKDASEIDIDQYLKFNFGRELTEDLKSNEINVADKEIIFGRKNGYLSDECVMLISCKNRYWQARFKLIDNPITQEHDFGTVTYRGGIFIEVFDADVVGLREQCASEQSSFTHLTLENIPSKQALTQLWINFSEGYKKGIELERETYKEDGEKAKNLAMELMQDNSQPSMPHDDWRFLSGKWGAQTISGNLGNYHTYAGIAAGNLLFLSENWINRERANPIQDLFKPFDCVAGIFGPDDGLKIQEFYNLMLDKHGGHHVVKNNKMYTGIPQNQVLKGCRIAEIGGNYIKAFESFGAECVYQNRNYGIEEFGGVKADEVQITSKNCKTHFPDAYDITMSRGVMDGASGVGTGFANDMEGSRDLLKAFAMMTRLGGISIHQGGAVPNDKEFLDSIDLELLCIIEGKPDPIFIFKKS